MFIGEAEDAMNLSLSTTCPGEILHVGRNRPGDPGGDRTVERTSLVISGVTLWGIGTPDVLVSGFTLAISLSDECQDDEIPESAAGQLSDQEVIFTPRHKLTFRRRSGVIASATPLHGQ